MSRCVTLEEYLQEFVDENTQSASNEELSLLITDRQAQTLGYFLINGLVGFIERMRLDKTSGNDEQLPATEDECSRREEDAEEFIN